METTFLSSGRARVKSSPSFATAQPCYPLSLTPYRLTSPPSSLFHSSDCQPGLLLRFSFPKFLQWLQQSEFQVSMWMCDLFHFPDGLAHCHDDIREGLVRVVRLVLNVNYPNLISDGFIALAASPPVRTCCCIVEMMVLQINHISAPGCVHHVCHLQRGGSVCLLSAQSPIIHHKVAISNNLYLI